MHERGYVSQFIDNNKEVACSTRDSDKYLLTNSSPERVSPSIILITPIGPLLIQNKLSCKFVRHVARNSSSYRSKSNKNKELPLL